MQPGAAQSFWQKLVKGDAGQSKHNRPLQRLSRAGESFGGKNVEALSMSFFSEGQMARPGGEAGCFGLRGGG